MKVLTPRTVKARKRRAKRLPVAPPVESNLTYRMRAPSPIVFFLDRWTLNPCSFARGDCAPVLASDRSGVKITHKHPISGDRCAHFLSHGSPKWRYASPLEVLGAALD